MTVQANNYKEMVDFVELGRRHHCDVVAFQQISDWGVMPPGEFAARAIQPPNHPEHATFIEVLSGPRLADPIVNLPNLTELRSWAIG